jgi:hypothetical protein
VKTLTKFSYEGFLITTFAGSSACNLLDGYGTSAAFCYLTGIAIDTSGTLYVTEVDAVRIISTAGVSILLAPLSAVNMISK